MTQNAHGFAPWQKRAHLGSLGSVRRLRCVVSLVEVMIMSAMSCCTSSGFDRSGHRSSMVRPALDWPAMTCL